MSYVLVVLRTKMSGHVVRVLDAMCDAVITLDDELRVRGAPGDGPVNGVTKLKALLALPSSSDVLLKPFVSKTKKVGSSKVGS